MLRWFCCLAIVWSWVSAASYMPLAENFILVQGAQVSLKGASVSLELRLDNNGDVREIFIETALHFLVSYPVPASPRSEKSLPRVNPPDG